MVIGLDAGNTIRAANGQPARSDDIQITINIGGQSTDLVTRHREAGRSTHHRKTTQLQRATSLIDAALRAYQQRVRFHIIRQRHCGAVAIEIELRIARGGNARYAIDRTGRHILVVAELDKTSDVGCKGIDLVPTADEIIRSHARQQE